MANRNVPRVLRACIHCGRNFTVSPSALKGGALYCSRACKDIAGRATKLTKTCKQCGGYFEVFPSKPKTKFCGRRCFGLNNQMTFERKFWSKVDKTDTCWLWTGATRPQGYGMLQYPKGKNKQAHRASWEIHHGPITDGLHVCHKCDIRNCVRPDHLFLGTATDNMQDCAKKGRQSCKLNPDLVREIRSRRASGVTIPVLAADYQVDMATIHHIVRRRFWRHVE